MKCVVAVRLFSSLCHFTLRLVGYWTFLESGGGIKFEFLPRSALLRRESTLDWWFIFVESRWDDLRILTALLFFFWKFANQKLRRTWTCDQRIVQRMKNSATPVRNINNKFTSSRSNWTRPSILILLFSLLPICLLWIIVSLMTDLTTTTTTTTTATTTTATTTRKRRDETSQNTRIQLKLPAVFNSAEIIKRWPLQMFRSVQQIRSVKVADVVSRNHVRINLAHKVGPFLTATAKIEHQIELVVQLLAQNN